MYTEIIDKTVDMKNIDIVTTFKCLYSVGRDVKLSIGIVSDVVFDRLELVTI